MAVHGSIDPFDLVTFIGEWLPQIRGSLDGPLFVVQAKEFAVGGVMLSADHGSAAMFTVLSGHGVGRDRFKEFFRFGCPAEARPQSFATTLVDQAGVDDQDLLGIVVNGVIGNIAVFEPLVW